MTGLSEMFGYIANHIFPEPIFVLIILVLGMAIMAIKSRASLPVGLMLGFLVLFSLADIGFGDFWVKLYYVVLAFGGGLVAYGVFKIASK